MNYTFRGKLQGAICSECSEPLSKVKVRLYQLQIDHEAMVLATADPKDTFTILTDAQIKSKKSFLIAETETDSDGNYVFQLGSSKKKYDGEAFEVDVYLKDVPHQKSNKKKIKPLQFTLTILQPQWRETKKGYVSIWDYILPKRFWCYIRARFGAWVICGYVYDCRTKPLNPIPGVKVIAFDRDWLQDDELGSAFTNNNGRFRIDYSISDFKKTPFSPVINIECTPGPDVYFKIEAYDGTVLLDEPSSRGRDSDRENVGPCFCVKLCVEEPVGNPGWYPYFTHVGDFNIASDIDSTFGLTNKAKNSHGGPDFGFLGKIKFKGFCPKTLPGDPTHPLYYRFLYIHPDDPTTEIPVTGNLVPGTTPSTGMVVGARILSWDTYGTGLQNTFQDIIIQRSGTASTPDGLPTPPVVPPGTPWGNPPPHILIPDTDGWIRVDQSPNSLDNGFYGTLMGFRSYVAEPGGSAPGPGAGNDPTLVQKNGNILRVIFENATDPSNPTTYNRQILEAHILVNNWIEVRQLDLQQFIGGSSGSCTGLTSDLNILYTADHELMRDWRITISSAASFTVPPPPLPSGTTPRGGFGNRHIDISTWPSCSYRVWLTTQRALTTGEVDDDKDSSLVTFCK